MIPRTLETRLRRAAAQYPVVSLTGSRQSGKTTLVRSVFSDYAYISLESPDHRSFALEDPRGFLAQFTERVVLDEVQRTPELFSYIQTLVDERNDSGQFILTGSQNFLLLQSVSQSLAGRCAVLHLLPFSWSEMHRRPPFPLAELGRTIPRERDLPDADLFDVLTKGFYPRIHDRHLDAEEWLRNYYQTYLERDVRLLASVGDLEAFDRFVRLCAGRSGQLLNLSALAVDGGISHTTARRWLCILEASFIIALLRPHFQNFNKRLIKSPKLCFLDPGLLCYLLRIRNPEDLRFHAGRGAVFEGFVVSELIKNALHQGEEPHFYFWRDSTGHEVDVILDRGSELVPLEIKSGETVHGDFFKGLEFWRKLAGEEQPAALIYAGRDSYMRRGMGMYSWSLL